jgi:hypothetical protein
MDWKQLLGSLSKSVDEELRLRNAYLAAENRILRQQIPGRVSLSDGDRHALAELGQQLGRKALEEIATVAKPDTILAWYRTFADQQCDRSQIHKSVGRPRIDKEIEDLVVRMARENRSWGYDRIVGALANLGYSIRDQTVGNIPKRYGIPPASERQKTVTWREFIRFHLDGLRATDFFTSAVWGWVGLVISSLLFFIPFGRHKAYGSGRISLVCKQWRLLIPWRSLEVTIYAQRWRRTVKEIARVQPVRFGEGRRHHFCESTFYAHRERLPRGMAKVARIPAVYPHPIWDGPLQRQQRLSRLRQSHCREAA